MSGKRRTKHQEWKICTVSAMGPEMSAAVSSRSLRDQTSANMQMFTCIFRYLHFQLPYQYALYETTLRVEYGKSCCNLGRSRTCSRTLEPRVGSGA